MRAIQPLVARRLRRRARIAVGQIRVTAADRFAEQLSGEEAPIRASVGDGSATAYDLQLPTARRAPRQDRPGGRARDRARNRCCTWRRSLSSRRTCLTRWQRCLRPRRTLFCCPRRRRTTRPTRSNFIRVYIKTIFNYFYLFSTIYQEIFNYFTYFQLFFKITTY